VLHQRPPGWRKWSNSEVDRLKRIVSLVDRHHVSRDRSDLIASLPGDQSDAQPTDQVGELEGEEPVVEHNRQRGNPTRAIRYEDHGETPLDEPDAPGTIGSAGHYLATP
jgi:hypothetical protein